MEDRIAEAISSLIGDTPVSVQIATALGETASKEDVDALRADLDALREKIETLIMLVGDTTVSEQINMAINKSEN